MPARLDIDITPCGNSDRKGRPRDERYLSIRAVACADVSVGVCMDEPLKNCGTFSARWYRISYLATRGCPVTLASGHFLGLEAAAGVCGGLTLERSTGRPTGWYPLFSGIELILVLGL